MATKLLILAVVHVATVHAAPHKAEASVPVQTLVVRSNFHAQDENGQYAYGYSSEDGQYKKEVKSIDGTVRGLYGYDAPDGRHVLVRYKADDDGFVAQSDFLEQPGTVAITRPVITVQQETVPDPREGDGITIQEEADDTDTAVQVDQDAYSNPGYSSYQQGTYYVSDNEGYDVAQYPDASSYVTPSSTSRNYYSSQSPVSSTTQNVDTGGLSEYDSYTSTPSGYSNTGSSSYYSYMSPAPSVGSTSASRKYYSPQTPVVYAVHEPSNDRRSQYAGYGVKHSDYSVYAQTPNRLTYDKLFYPSRTSVVYVPPSEPRVYYPKDDSYTYSTVKPAYEVRHVETEERDPYNPKTRVAVNVLHHGTPSIAVQHAPLVSVTPVPLHYSSAPVVKVHVGSPAVSVASSGSPSTYQVTPAPAVKTVSLTPIHVKVHNPAVHSSYVVSSTPAVHPSYVVSSTPASVKVVNPSVYKTKHVSIANPFKVHYASPAVKVKAPSVQAHSYYYTVPSPAYKTVSSYATAGKTYPSSAPVQGYSYYYTDPSPSYKTVSSYASAGQTYPSSASVPGYSYYYTNPSTSYKTDSSYASAGQTYPSSASVPGYSYYYTNPSTSYKTDSSYASAGKTYPSSAPVQGYSYYYTNPSTSYKTDSSYASAGQTYPSSTPVQGYSYYHTVPSPSYKTVSSHASAGQTYPSSASVPGYSYYTFPSSAYKTVSSYTTAGKSYPYNLFPYSSYQYQPLTSVNSYLPSTSLYGAYQPGYSYFIQSPMAAVSSNLHQTYFPSASVSSVKYHTPVKVDNTVNTVTRHTY